MRRALVGTVVALLLCAGCSINREFVYAVDTSWSVIGPEYTAYVDADPRLDETSKAIRKRTAETLTRLIEKAKEQE
jgi:hypothetical protein